MKLSELITWVDAHWYQILATWAALIVAWKAVPERHRIAIERRIPRVVNAIRVLYSLGPDVLKAVAAIRAIWTGTPKLPEGK